MSAAEAGAIDACAATNAGVSFKPSPTMRTFRPEASSAVMCAIFPAGKTAVEGVYVRDYAKDLLGALALESVRNNIVIVGEDLGIVPEGFRPAMQKCEIQSDRVFFFE